MLSIFLHHSHSTVKREWRDWIRHSSAATRPGCHRHFLRWPERRALAPAAADTVSSTSFPEGRSSQGSLFSSRRSCRAWC
uniref:Uncharacterized protein n=1 Tax=Oryza punctata TaxID=4537 RepID=A0A0E0MMF6_ORYPU